GPSTGSGRPFDKLRVSGELGAARPELVEGSELVEGTPAARVLRPGAELNRPESFTTERLDWAPWLEPLDLADATPEQLAALEGRQTNSLYFRLLARDAAVLLARTATDRGIF